MLIDTHCHLDAHYFPEGEDAVMERARAAGVGHFVVIGVGEDLAHVERAVTTAEAHTDVHAAIGVHPHDAAKSSDAWAERIEALAASPKVKAIGEIGLDHHYEHSPADVQAATFRRFIALARKLGLPIVVHTREAATETIEILRDEGASDVGGIIHCFSEDVPFARAALDLGFDLSFSGIVTFKSAEPIREAARFCPVDRILVETDSPYLAPIPMRGKRCEPAYVAHTARFVANLRGETEEDFARATTANAARRFGITLSA